MAARASSAEAARRALPVTAALERRSVQYDTKGPSGVLRTGGVSARWGRRGYRTRYGRRGWRAA